jgi:putative ABC transport system permease protein
MMLLHRLASILRWLVHRNRVEQDLNDEVQAFVDMAAADKVSDGVLPTEARRLAVLDLGGIEQTKERVRTYRHGALLGDVGRDVRYAFRMFAKHPSFTFVIVLTLALGVGANTAIFSLIDALMLRWLPVRNPQELVQLTFTSSDAKSPATSFSYPIARAMADQHEIFAGVAGTGGGTNFDVGAPGSVSRVSGAMVTGEYYETLGVNPVIGRLLTPDDDERGAPLVAVISYGYWERQFAQSFAAVGQRLLVNGVPVTIIGVSPRGFVGTRVGGTTDVTMPVAALPQISPDAAPLLGPGNFWLDIIARLQPGISIPDAEARLAAVWPQISEPLIAPHWPAFQRTALAEATFQLSPGGTGETYLRRIYVKPLMVLMAMVAVVLLIACANVTSLLLARASARQKEIAVRLAIGAGRGRIVRQLLIESTLLSLMGAACGIVVAWLSGRFLISLISTGPARVAFDLTPNWHILGFTGAVAIATAVFFGVVPALRATAAEPSAALKDDATMSGSRSRLLPFLVSAQVALSLVLLVGAGLFGRTLQNLQNLDPGFRADGVLLVNLEARQAAVSQQLADDLLRLPGVVAASVSTHTPLSGATWSEPAVPAGQPLPERDTALFVGAGPRFFATMQIPLRSGRAFTETDTADSPAVAVINEKFATRYFAGQSALGQHLSAKVRGRRRDLEVVGVVKNTHQAGLRQAPRAMVYVSYAQVTGGDVPVYPTLEIRAVGALGHVTVAVRQALQRRLPSETIDVRPLSVQVDATIVQERMMATLAGAFGLLALTLACVGLYGLLAYSVAKRVKEIGIRMALGAQRRQVIVQVLGRAARLVVIGVVVGAPAAWAASRWVESMLFGVTPTDPTTIGGAVILMTLAVQIAAYVPARRASRVNPLVALRHD